jgi:hypothetical protein
MKQQSRGGRKNRYGRFAEAFLNNEKLTVEALAKQADVSIGTAKYCRAAFNAIREALLLKGWRPPED